MYTFPESLPGRGITRYFQQVLFDHFTCDDDCPLLVNNIATTWKNGFCREHKEPLSGELDLVLLNVSSVERWPQRC